MLNSAEHEICPANKSEIANNCKFLLNIAEHENFSANKYENAKCWPWGLINIWVYLMYI